MAEAEQNCPSCGEPNFGGSEWCENCGAALAGVEAVTHEWLETADRFRGTQGDAHVIVEVGEPRERFASRRASEGSVVDVAGDIAVAVGASVVVEEISGDEEAEVGLTIPEQLRPLFRLPIARGTHGEHRVNVFSADTSITLEDLVDASRGELSFQQLKDVFTSVLDLVVKVHREGYLLFALGPWTLRVKGGRLGIPSDEADDGLQQSADPTLENPLPTAEEISAARIAEAAADGDVTLVPGSAANSLAASGGEEGAGQQEPEESDEQVEFDLDPPEPEFDFDLSGGSGANVDSDWDAFDEVGNDTGIISPRRLLGLQAEDVVAQFDSLETVFPQDKQPDEVPVIMGFSPPELLGRIRADVGPWCDVFALGMLLHFLVTGKVPPASVYTRYAPALPARNMRPGFPPGLQTVINRATRPTPSDRFQSVQALRDAFLNACALMEKRSAHVGGTGSPRVVLAVDTHVGIAKRRRNPVNQDAVFGRVADDGRFALLVVADGVSTASYGSGDLASHCLKRAAEASWDQILPNYLMDEQIDETQIILDLLEAANEEIVEYVNGRHTPFEGNPHEVMGSTALVAVIHNGTVTLAALGDSRAYIQTPAGLEQITTDHNLWTLSILEGVPADAALGMQHGEALARCLGTFVVESGNLTAVRPDPDFFRFHLAKGDNLLLTTDGLIDFAGATPFQAEENILAVMLAEPDPNLACLELLLLANRGGGGDNIGVGIAKFV